MHNETHDLRVSARTARLTAGATDDEDDGPPYRFSGVAVAAGDVLHMDDGTRVLFDADELQKAARTQAGEPLSVDHPEDDEGRPTYPPPTDETVGKVPKAGWLDTQQAVGYEATTHDEEIATGVRAGSYDVSVHPTFAVEAYAGDEADVRAVDIEFKDLSVVSKGDSPSATAEYGRSEALASYTVETDVGAELTAQDDPTITEPEYDGYADAGWDAPTLSGTYDGDLEAAANAAVVEFQPVETFSEDLALFVVDGEEQLNTNALDSAWVLAPQVEGLDDDAVDRARDQLESLAEAARDDDAIDDEEWTDVWQPRVDGEVTGSDAGLVRRTLDRTLRAIGIDVGGGTSAGENRDETTGAATESDSGSPADADADGSSQNMDKSTREQYVQFLTANAGFDEESVAAMDDDVLENTYELAAEATADADGDGGSTAEGSGDDPEDDDETDGQTLADMTVDELGEALREQGFVTEADAPDVVEEAQAQASKAEKVEEIIAKSDDYDEDDREDLLASAGPLVEREYKRVRGAGAATLPGAAGAASTLTASAGSDDDPSDYGTGVQED